MPSANSYRAAGWFSKDKQASVRLTEEDQSKLTDEELLKAAMNEAENIGLDIADGEIIISSWSD